MDTTKPISCECFGDSNDPTYGTKFTQTNPFIFLEHSAIDAGTNASV